MRLSVYAVCSHVYVLILLYIHVHWQAYMYSLNEYVLLRMLQRRAMTLFTKGVYTGEYDTTIIRKAKKMTANNWSFC